MKHWTETDCAALIRMRNDGASLPTRKQLRDGELPRRKPGRKGDAEPAQKAARRWTDAENDELIARCDRGDDFGAVGKLLDRTRWACKVQYNQLKRKAAARQESPAVVRAAPVRLPTLPHPTLTAAILGDPLPGRSALDQKRGIAP